MKSSRWLCASARLLLLLPVLLLVPATALDTTQQQGTRSASSRLPLWARSSQASLRPWDERLGEEGTAAHVSMENWLDKFFAAEEPGALFPAPPRQPETKPRRQVLPPRNVTFYNETPADRHTWTKWNVSESCDAMLKAAPRPKRRTNLIVAPVGSGFNASLWLTHPDHATYDIVALYYGSSPDFSCPLCKAVIRGHGTKWHLLNSFTKQNATLWASLARQYQAVMVADDDLQFDTCTLNRAFEVFHAYGLLLAQPSLCSSLARVTYWGYLHQQPDSMLRFITFVEIMAPIFQMSFFEGLVRPTLYNAFTGWGLDFTWPFLMRYPKKRIAVIDEVCMVHAAPVGSKSGEGDLYSVPVPYDEREEETRRVGEYGYYPSRVEAMGLPYRNMETLGVVRKTYLSAADVAAAPPPPLALLFDGEDEVGQERERQLLAHEHVQAPMTAARALVAAAGAVVGATALAALVRRKGRRVRRVHSHPRWW